MTINKVISLGLCMMMVLGLFATSFLLTQNPVDIRSSTGQKVNSEYPEKEPLDRGTRAPPGWMNEIRLTNSIDNSTTPEVAVWGSNVHVVWSDDRDGNYEIFYKRSTDNGLSWGTETQITFTTISQELPKIGVYGNTIHIVWHDYMNGTVSYINSTDNGDSWGTITMWDWTSYPPCAMFDPLLCPDVAVDENNVYIIAYVLGPEDLIFKRSNNSGGSWSNWILVSDFGWYWSSPTIETDGSLIHVVYDITIGSPDSLYHFFSDDGGDTWWDDIFNPFVDHNEVYENLVSFETSMDGDYFRVAYSMWNATLATIKVRTMYWSYSPIEFWYGPYEVGNNSEGDIDVEKDHIVWNGEDTNNYTQVFSSKYGQATDYPSDSSMPTIAISGDLVHIVWVDPRDGNNELYYSQRGLLADLILSNSDIQFDPPSPVEEGMEVFINATVFCSGKSASSVEVKFYNGNPDLNGDLIPDVTADVIGSDTININADASAIASLKWTPPSDGTYDIFVWVDPDNLTEELDESNNIGFNTLEVFSLPPTPPLNLGAEISPGALDDVELSWDASSDDGSGEDDVVGYSVYKSSTGVSGTYEFEAWILATDSTSYSWIDSGAGDGDLNDYFYIVRANDTLNNEEQNTDKVGKMVNSLVLGWNMISVPLIQSNTSAEGVLQTLELNYATIQGYHSGKSRPWLHWHRDKPNYFNDEIDIIHERGYYIDMVNPDYLVVAGKVPTNTQISLKAGWNLVGYPSPTTRTSDDALSSISGSYNKVEFYDTYKGKEGALGPLDDMYPNLGYWVHAMEDCVWELLI
ncbi:MAG: hypothetical protein JSW00_09230 [Thermoplasmata archaeon]|nr:MAG: hypothetical protein JSW00_09230 [Thermoplasmata archaeon]